MTLAPWGQVMCLINTHTAGNKLTDRFVCNFDNYDFEFGASNLEFFTF